LPLSRTIIGFATTSWSVWDLATWLRRVPDERIAAIVRRRHSSETLEAATVLRGLQEEVWNVLHDARIEGRLTRVRC
jgi:hypothetical protein